MHKGFKTLVLLVNELWREAKDQKLHAVMVADLNKCIKFHTNIDALNFANAILLEKLFDGKLTVEYVRHGLKDDYESRRDGRYCEYFACDLLVCFEPLTNKLNGTTKGRMTRSLNFCEKRIEDDLHDSFVYPFEEKFGLESGLEYYRMSCFSSYAINVARWFDGKPLNSLPKKFLAYREEHMLEKTLAKGKPSTRDDSI